MRYILISIVFLFGHVLGQAQNSTNEIVIHKDKPMYFIGDLAAYKVYLPENVFEVGTMFNVRLTAEDNTIAQSHFVKVKSDMTLSGYFKLPFSYSAGIYKADFIVFDETTKKEIFIADTWVPLYDDLEPAIDKSLINGNSQMNEVASRDMDWDVTGDDVSMTIKLDDMIEVGSISIQLKSAIPYRAYNSCQYGANGNYSKKIFLSGKLQGPSGNNLTNRLVASYIGQDEKHTLLKTNDEGGFTLMFDDFVQTKEIQLIDLDPNPVVVTIVNTNSLNELDRPKLVYTDAIIDLLRRKKEQRRIARYFDAPTKNVEFEKAEVEKIENENTSKSKKGYKVDDSYEFNDYKVFDDFAIFANEVTQNLVFKERAKKYESNYVFYISNGNYRNVGKEVFLKPFFILDGKITRDADYIGRLSQPLLERLELEYEPRKMLDRYSLFGKEGIVRIYSKTGNLPIPQDELGSLTSLGGLQDQIVKYNNVSDSSKPILDDFPYWNSMLNTTSARSFNVTSPSDPGEYELIIIGNINGQLGVSKKTYMIK